MKHSFGLIEKFVCSGITCTAQKFSTTLCLRIVYSAVSCNKNIPYMIIRSARISLWTGLREGGKGGRKFAWTLTFEPLN